MNLSERTLSWPRYLQLMLPVHGNATQFSVCPKGFQLTAPMKNPPLTASRLKEVLELNKETWRFTWVKHYHARYIGKEAGKGAAGNYRQISVDGVRYMEHRLVWLYCHGEWPKTELDHRDLNKQNNYIKNLRECSHSFNCQNQRKGHAGSKTGVLGTSIANGRFVAHIVINGKKNHLGSFSTLEEASLAYISAKKKFHSGSTI